MQALPRQQICLTQHALRCLALTRCIRRSIGICKYEPAVPFNLLLSLVLRSSIGMKVLSLYHVVISASVAMLVL